MGERISSLYMPTDFSVRKFARKVKADGLKSALIAAPELVVRNKIGRPIFEYLASRGTIHIVNREELLDRSASRYSIDSEFSEEGCEPPFLVELDNAFVFPTTGLAVTNQLELLEESVTSPINSRQITMAAISRQCFYDDISTARWLLRSDQKYLRANAETVTRACLIAPRHPNYYHWMIETVPRIRYLEKYVAQTGNEVTLLIPSGLPAWASQTLDLLGWPNSKIEILSSPAVHVENLVLPSFPEPNVNDLQWIRKRILENESPDADATDFGKNIYISRSNAIERRVINEEEVMNALSKYNFERFHLEERSLSQNAHMFNNAELIVGPHGAGLTDLIFSTDGSVLELFGSKVKQPYERLSSILGIKYESLGCSPKSTDIVVDPERLETKVQDML